MAELQEQVNDLLANLSFRQRVDADPDMEGSSLTVVPAFVPSKATSAKKKKKPKKPSMVGGLGISMGEEAVEEAETTGS
jgi:predicted alternative tryptophan synthase beta-subunit